MSATKHVDTGYSTPIYRTESGWYEVSSTVRRFVVKPISGGWVLIGGTHGGTFDVQYSSSVNLDVMLNTAVALAAADEDAE